MPLSSRSNRPSPLKLALRDDEPTFASLPSPPNPDSPSPTRLPSPESPDTSSPTGLSGPESPDLPSTTETSPSEEPPSPTSSDLPPATETPTMSKESPSVTSFTQPGIPVTTDAVLEPSSTSLLPSGSAITESLDSSTAPLVQTSSSSSTSTSISSLPQTTADLPVLPLLSTSSSSLRRVDTSSTAPIAITGLGNTASESKAAQVSRPSTISLSGTDPAEENQSSSGTGLPQKSLKKTPHISKVAEGALITFVVLGVLALLVGAFLYYRCRQRKYRHRNMRHTEDTFSPTNSSSLHPPETAHVPSSISNFSLFAGDSNHRPITASTDSSRSRFQGFESQPIHPPLPSANPFTDDPDRNKAYDVLRGRPRSTTLTDRGDWVANPFKDPLSDRFDPFGELEEKARIARLKYVDDVRREQEETKKLQGK
ncbi:hypothetical protein GQ43DRAFT_432281 [Delitschia confertaspora ATCC 74209]|uniref:Uncharacterized protein n=1 Tax=Delitschia confertaspora ATCC 74209 TaxID=1513339 RepID=A0A9P4JM16_9PLEO|nr:hypothetical protein GQ43DRAFT_432281 [Delitschia confertaspora ATCC 74209]